MVEYERYFVGNLSGMKNSLISLAHLLIILILVANVGLVAIGGDILVEDGSIKYILSGVVLFLEALVIIGLIKSIYERPIIELEYTIKKFISGQLKNQNIDIEGSINPHIDYVIKFFTKTLNTLKNIKDEFIHGKEIKSEVSLAREIQDKLLSKKLLEAPSLNVIARSKPAGEIGGDSFDVLQEGDNYYIYVGDATGHGVGAGFIMMMVNALINGFIKIAISGAQILANTNNILKPRVKANLLMTLLLIRWNEKEKRLFMTGAGHENLLIYKNSTQKCYKIKSGGVALGMIKDASKLIKEQEIKFEPNDIIVLYSDGITEAIDRPRKDGKEKMFGEELLIAAIEKAPNVIAKNYKNASNVFNSVTIELSKFMGYQHTQLDDITLAVIHYRGENYDSNDDVYTPIPNDLLTEWHW